MFISARTDFSSLLILLILLVLILTEHALGVESQFLGRN